MLIMPWVPWATVIKFSVEQIAAGGAHVAVMRHQHERLSVLSPTHGVFLSCGEFSGIRGLKMDAVIKVERIKRYPPSFVVMNR